MKAFITSLFLILFFSCVDNPENSVEIEVQNSLDFDRSHETLEIDLEDLKALQSKSFAVIDMETKDTLASQMVNYEDPDKKNVLLFQPEIKASSSKSFRIVGVSAKTADSSMTRCFSRFVPERTDDYAWENNRVAFRTYGPTAQKMVEDSVAGGTLSSGIDAWLKRVEYPIIDKWYDKYTSGKGTYHEDTGEGLDNFHVGVSRGVGGIAIKTDSAYLSSKNFSNWKTITNGPIRTSFILTYDSWDANGQKIEETKHISLDYGQNLSRFEIEISGTNRISAGLTLHKQDGEVTTNSQEGWMSYWEPFDDSELGQGLVVDTNQLIGFEEYITSATDQSNLYAQIKTNQQKAVYYAGFGWKKSGQFKSKDAWNAYLSNYAKCIQNPLKLTVKTKG